MRRRLLLLLFLPVLAAVAAGLVTEYLLVPVYQASTTLWVIRDDAAQMSYNDLLLNRNLTRTYAEVGRSHSVMADVIDRLNLSSVTVEMMRKKVKVAVVHETELLSFTVEDSDPVLAARLADAFATAFIEQIRSFMKVQNVAVVDPAVVPVEPVGPRLVLNVAVAFVLGAMLAVGLAFLLEYLDTSVRTLEDVQRSLDLPVLATIPVFQIKAAPEAPSGTSPVASPAVGERGS